MSRFPPLGATSPRACHPGGSPLWKRGDRGDSPTTLAWVGDVRRGYLAGGARRRITFFACAKKVTKESTPCRRRNPEDSGLAWAAKELAALKQLSPASGFPSQVRNPRLRQKGCKPSHRDAFSPLTPPLGVQSHGGSRRAMSEPAGRVCEPPVGLGAERGFRRKRGGLLWVTFLGQARKVTRRRATPGHTTHPNA